MLKKSAAAKTALIATVIAIALVATVVFGLARSTDNGPLSTAPILSFSAAGDFGATDNTKAVLKKMGELHTDFSLALGDLSYGHVTEQQWCDMVHDGVGENYPFEILTGNHDNKQGSSIPQFTKCLPNKMAGMTGEYAVQYAFDYKNTARIIAIAPDDRYNSKHYTYASGTSEYNWLVDQIDSARKQNIPWVVVSMHEVCETMGIKSCEITPELFSLLVEKKVDLVLQGHEHSYMRTRQLSFKTDCPAADSGSVTDVCALGNKTSYVKGDGPVVVMNGSGGVEMREINLDSPDKNMFAAWHGSNAQPAYGPIVIDVWNDKLQGRFIDTNGAVRDSFTIHGNK
jgi:hypothetical protein